MKKILLITILLIAVVKVWGQQQSISISPEHKRNYPYAIYIPNFKFDITYYQERICYNLVKISAIHPNRTSSVIYSSSNHHIAFPSNGYYFFVTKETTNLNVFAESTDERDRWPLSNHCDEEIIIDKNTEAITPCITKTFQATASRSDIRNQIEFTYRVIPLHILESETNHLPVDDKIVFSDRAGFANSLYSYQFSLNNITWHEIPNSFYNADKLTVSARDLLNLLGEDWLQYINKNIFLRSSSSCSNSEVLPLTIIPSAPHIENVTYEMPTCRDDNDAKLRIKFDRALYSESTINEKLYVSLKGSRFTEQTAIATIDPITHEYVIPNLEADTFDIALLGVAYYYKNGTPDSVYTFTEGAKHRDTIVIPERPALKLESITQNSVNCYGGSDGKINIKVSGGVRIYNAYLVGIIDTNHNGRCDTHSGREIYRDTIFNFAENTIATFKDLRAGAYTVSIIDTNRCTKDSNGIDVKGTINVTEPAAGVLISELYWEEPLGFGLSNGLAQVYFKGGTPGMPPYTVEWRDSTNAIITANTTIPVGDRYLSKVENIKSSTYYVTVRDANYSSATPANEVNLCGCFDTISFFVTEPPKLEVEIDTVHYVTCYGDNDGVLVAHGTGGREHLTGDFPYTYEWFEIANGTTIPIGTNDSILSNLYTGYYRVKITDRNSIVAYSDTFHLTQPDTLVVTTTVLQNVLCNNENTGAIRATVTGGTPPYTYLWSTNETTQEISGLPIGGYVVYVRDSRFVDKGLSGHYCFAQVQTFINSPNEIEFNEQIIHPTCHNYSDGSISLNITGGESPYTYEWEDGSTQSSRTNLSAGTYSVIITDDNNCKVTGVFTVNNPDAIVVNLGNDITLCKNQTKEIDGSIDITGITYTWTNQSGSVVSNLPKYEIGTAGIYTLTATSNIGCVGSDEIIVSQSNEEIDVDFVIATKVANNTKLNAVNITRLSLDDIEWILPDEAVVLDQTVDGVQLMFTQNGTYVVGLIGRKGLCEKTLYKTISVVNKNEIDEDESSEPFLKRFIAVPNPNDGNFEAIIELREATEFRLVLYNINGAIIESTPTYNAMTKTIQFNQNVSAGVYFLKFISRQTTSTFKVMIN